jgi:hypothetical protein
MPKVLPPVTYKEIWDIACNDKLSLKKRKDKLEGCARRIVTEAINKAPFSKARRNDIDYRMIEVMRAFKHLYETTDHSKC